MTNEFRAKKMRYIGDLAEEQQLTEAPPGRNIIVAIGINQYQHLPQLDNPINDALAVVTLFKQCGFQELSSVSSLVANDATRQAMAKLPNQLARTLKSDDNLILFYAGHGEKIEAETPDPVVPGKTRIHRTGYLIPIDGPEDEPGDWISLDWFLDAISALPARHILVILDACNSGIALSEKFKSRGVDQPAAITELQRRPSRRVITSAMHDEKAHEGGSGTGHSLFCEAIIAAIQDGQAARNDNDFVKTVDLFSFVQDRVINRAKELDGSKQTPDYGYLPGDGGGDLVVSLRKGAFSRLIQEALAAMQNYDVSRLDELVVKLIAASPNHPVTLYLLYRLKFMQGDLIKAMESLAKLKQLEYDETLIPLRKEELCGIKINLNYLKPLLSIPPGKPPIEIKMLTGRDLEVISIAPVLRQSCGEVYQVENGAAAQFAVTNLGNTPAYLYHVTISPEGKYKYGPFPSADAPIDGLATGVTLFGRPFRIHRILNSVTEIRVLYSPVQILELAIPRNTPECPDAKLSHVLMDQLEMTPIWYQVLGGMLKDK